MRFQGDTRCVGAVCIVSKVLTLITFGSVYSRAHFRPNRKLQDPEQAHGWKRGTARMLADTWLETSLKRPKRCQKVRIWISLRLPAIKCYKVRVINGNASFQFKTNQTEQFFIPLPSRGQLSYLSTDTRLLAFAWHYNSLGLVSRDM